MTSAAIELARSAGGRHGEGRWMIIFARSFAGSGRHYVIGDLRAQGWATLIFRTGQYDLAG
jgi:hypothetical protein